MTLLCKHPFHLVAGDPDVFGERKFSAADDRMAAAVADRNQKLVGRTFPHRRRHSLRHLAKQRVGDDDAHRPDETSAERLFTTTGFSPVAPQSAPAFIMAAVAMLLVPTAVRGRSGNRFFNCSTIPFPIRPPWPSIITI